MRKETGTLYFSSSSNKINSICFHSQFLLPIKNCLTDIRKPHDHYPSIKCLDFFIVTQNKLYFILQKKNFNLMYNCSNLLAC